MSKYRLTRAASSDHPVYMVKREGVYLFIVEVKASSSPSTNFTYTAQAVIEMKTESGYLSVVDWPLLPVILAIILSKFESNLSSHG